MSVVGRREFLKLFVPAIGGIVTGIGCNFWRNPNPEPPKDFLPSPVKRNFPQVEGVMTILVAAGLGLLAGYLGLEGLTLQAGLLAGLSAVGLTTIAKKIGTK